MRSPWGRRGIKEKIKTKTNYVTMRQNSRKWGMVCVSQDQMHKNSHRCSVLGFDTIQEGKKAPWWLWLPTSHSRPQPSAPSSVGWTSLEDVREQGEEILQLNEHSEHGSVNKKVREKCSYCLAQHPGTLGGLLCLTCPHAAGGSSWRTLQEKKTWYEHTHAHHFVL